MAIDVHLLKLSTQSEFLLFKDRLSLFNNESLAMALLRYLDEHNPLVFEFSTDVLKGGGGRKDRLKSAILNLSPNVQILYHQHKTNSIYIALPPLPLSESGGSGLPEPPEQFISLMWKIKNLPPNSLLAFHHSESPGYFTNPHQINFKHKLNLKFHRQGDYMYVSNSNRTS